MENDTIRIGKVSDVDYEKGLIRVAYLDRDNNVTAPMPMLSDKYFMPEVGDQVIVLHLSNGAEAGIVLGRFYTDKNLPKESGKGVFFMTLDRSGASFIKCASGTVTIKGEKITFNGDVSVTGGIAASGNISAGGSISASGNITASGDVNAGGISLRNHTHTGVHGETSGPH